MPIEDAIKAIKEAKSQISIVFESFQYMLPPYSDVIVCSVYNEDVIEQLPIVTLAIASFLLNDDCMSGALANAMMEASYPIILFFHTSSLSMFGDNLIVNFISKLRHPITLMFGNMEINYTDIDKVIAPIMKKVDCPITLVFENSSLNNSSIHRLATAVKEARVPSALYFIESYISSCESLVRALKEAQAPIHIAFDDTDEFDKKIYDSVKQDNFAIEARINPSEFLRRLGFSMVSLMINKTLFFCPKVLLELIKSYISDADIAWMEVLAIRNVEGASHENKYASINTTELMLKYFFEDQVCHKKQAMKSKNPSSIDTNYEATPYKLLTEFLDHLYMSPHITSAVTLPEGFKGRETLIKFLTLVQSCIVPSMTIPPGFINVPSDGLCFYHAVARQLDAVDGLELQREAVNEILINYKRYQDFLEDNFWDDNLESPGKDNRGWAGHVMIQAVANMLHRPIEIRRFGLDGIENQDKVLILPYEFSANLLELRLGNIANLHFVAANITLLAEQTGMEYSYPAVSYAYTDSGVAINQEPLKSSGENTESHEYL